DGSQNAVRVRDRVQQKPVLYDELDIPGDRLRADVFVDGSHHESVLHASLLLWRIVELRRRLESGPAKVFMNSRRDTTKPVAALRVPYVRSTIVRTLSSATGSVTLRVADFRPTRRIAVLLIFAVLFEASAALAQRSAEELNRQIDDVIHQSRYTWRMPHD